MVRAAAVAAAGAALAFGCAQGERAGTRTAKADSAAPAVQAAPPPGAGSVGDTAAVATATVDMPRSYLFRPETLTVRAGTRVTWTNHDVFTHGVDIPVGTVHLVARPGQQISHVFAGPGVYRYVCPFHPQMMKGVIRVER